MVMPAELITQNACHDRDPELFFPDKTAERHIARAVAVCRNCPVRQLCYEWALDNDLWFGIFAGLTPHQRAAAAGIKRRTRASGYRQLDPCGSIGAIQRHRRRGEPLDPACVEGDRSYRRELREARKDAIEHGLEDTA